MALDYSQMFADADAFEVAGDLQSALNIYYRMIGPFSVTSTSKDGMTVTFDAESRNAKIAQLERRLMKASGAGKVRTVPFVVVPVNRSPPMTGGDTVYDSDGYAWGW
jgi:hypothetical protein